MSEYGMTVQEFSDIIYSDPLYTAIFFILSFSFIGLLLYGLKPIKRNKSLDDFTNTKLESQKKSNVSQESKD